MTSFWVYDNGGGGGDLIANNLPDAIAEMDRTYPDWRSVNSMWVLVEVNEDANMQRFWINDTTQTKWEAF